MICSLRIAWNNELTDRNALQGLGRRLSGRVGLNLRCLGVDRCFPYGLTVVSMPWSLLNPCQDPKTFPGHVVQTRMTYWYIIYIP